MIEESSRFPLAHGNHGRNASVGFLVKALPLERGPILIPLENVTIAPFNQAGFPGEYIASQAVSPGESVTVSR